MANNLSILMENIKQLNWTRNGDFLVELYPVDKKFDDLTGWTFSNMTSLLRTSIVSVALPERTPAVMRKYFGGEWHFTVARDEATDMNIVVRDFEGGLLYNKFVDILNKSKVNYTSKTKFKIRVSVRCGPDSGQNSGSFDESGYQNIYENDNVILTRVGGLEFKYDDESFLTFTIMLTCGLSDVPQKYGERSDAFMEYARMHITNAYDDKKNKSDNQNKSDTTGAPSTPDGK